MSRLTYWPLMSGCVLLVGLYAGPAWSIVHASDLPSSQGPHQLSQAGQLVQTAQRSEKSPIAAQAMPETKQDVVASVDARL